METLRSGSFNKQLFDRIKECTDFVLVCSPGALDRCLDNKDDWVRQELSCALASGKNVIPVMLRNFTFPDVEVLPEDIRQVYYCNGITASHDHFEAFIKKLLDFLKTKKGPGQFIRSLPFNGFRAGFCILLALIIAGGAAFGISKSRKPSYFPGTNQEISCFDRVFTYQYQEMAVYDQCYYIYKSTLDELGKYCSGTSVFQPSYTFDEYAADAADKISEHLSSLQTVDEYDSGLIDASNQYLGSKIDIGDINAMNLLMQLTIQDMSNKLNELGTLYRDCGRDVKNPALVATLESYTDLSMLDKELMFYEFNNSMISVDNPDTLSKIKNEYLPTLVSVYRGQDWAAGKDDIASKIENIYNRQDQILGELSNRALTKAEQNEALIKAYADYEQTGQELIGEEQFANLSTEEMLSQLDIQIRRLENEKVIYAMIKNDKDAAAARYDEHIEGLRESRDSLYNAYKRLCGKIDEIARLKEQLKEQYKPLETDDPGILWGKGMLFASAGIPEYAAECYNMYAQYEGSPEAAVYGRSAAYFAEKMSELEISGGAIVCGYEEGLPKQDLQIGDIVYAYDGSAVTTVDRLPSKSTNPTSVYSVIRFSEDGEYQLIEVTYDYSKGRILYLDLTQSLD